MWKIEFTASAVEDLKKIPKDFQTAIKRAVCERISVDPYRFKPLKGDRKGCYRLRVANYRIIYEVREKEITILIIKVGLRRNIYM
jgi:mRNA interferase RelE/StbE